MANEVVVPRFYLGLLAVLLLGIFAIACGNSQSAEQPPAQSSAPGAFPQGQAILPQDARRLGIDPNRHKAGEITQYTIRIAANPQDADAYWLRGEALMEQGFIYNDKTPVLQAVEDLTRGIQLDPKGYLRGYVQRGVAYTYLKDKTRAELDFAKARSLGVRQEIINDRLGELAQYSRYWK